MWYEYRCDTCETILETQTFSRIGQSLCPCGLCGGSLIRIVSLPQVTPATGEPYFNHSVGAMVTSNRDFEEKLRVGGLQQEERTGIPTRHVPVYPDEGRKMLEQINGPNVELPS